MNKIFLLGVDSAVSFQSKVVQLFVERDTYTNSIPIWQSPRTMILRKDLRKDFKLYFDLTVNLLREFDFLNKAFRDFPYSQMLESRHQTDSYGRDLYTNFNSLQAYINRHTSIAPLSFADLDYLFRLFFLLLVSPLVHLLAVKLARWALVHLQPIRVIFRAVFARFGRICKNELTNGELRRNSRFVNFHFVNSSNCFSNRLFQSCSRSFSDRPFSPVPIFPSRTSISEPLYQFPQKRLSMLY